MTNTLEQTAGFQKPGSPRFSVFATRKVNRLIVSWNSSSIVTVHLKLDLN